MLIPSRVAYAINRRGRIIQRYCVFGAAAARYRDAAATSTGFFPHVGHGAPTQSAYVAIASSVVVGNCDSALHARQFVTNGPLPFIASRTRAAS